MSSRAARAPILALTIAPLLISSATAQRQQYCERTNYSAQQITDAVRASPLREELKSTSCSLGGLGRFESGGNKGVYNGSCCTGIFQLNRTNVTNYTGLTREQFGCESLQFQVNAWARLTNDGYKTGAVQELMSRGTFDGQKVDASFIASCIQLGTGNCQQMVRSGRCSGFSDSNGTTICDMARNARSNADSGCRDDGSSPQACTRGDFPTTPSVAGAAPSSQIGAITPSPQPTDILVGSGMATLRRGTAVSNGG